MAIWRWWMWMVARRYMWSCCCCLLRRCDAIDARVAVVATVAAVGLNDARGAARGRGPGPVGLGLSSMALSPSSLASVLGGFVVLARSWLPLSTWKPSRSNALAKWRVLVLYALTGSKMRKTM
eukprot:scaffold81728_cov22-Tisochrysis_lutea.AAC.1